MGEGIHLYGDRAPHNLQYVVLVASANLTEERVLTGTANQITITDNGAGSTVVLSLSSTLLIPGVITIPNTGLHILDTNASHDLIIAPGSDLTADRTLTLTTGDAARTITLSGNPTLNDWFDQSVKVADSPTFAGVTLGNTGLHLLDTNASHDLIIAPGSDLTADRTLTLTTGDAARTITLSGNPTLNDWFDQAVKAASSPTFAGVTLGNTGLHLLDTNASHDLIIAPGSDLTADRTLTLTTGDAARTITLSGNPTLNDWFDQAVKQASSPTFADVFVPDGGTLGISGNELLTFNAAGTAVFSGCNVGIAGNLEVNSKISTGAANLVIESATNLIQMYKAAAATELRIYDAGAAYTSIGTASLVSLGPVKIKEAANAIGDTVAYGQFWVKDDAPCIPMYTDDAGADFTVDITAV